ncbi:MAG TPA: GGDEF domain-containing protein [Planctomycetota bacterium]|nr:GGDEF domain-containing protein [Planctomycetota bacterium]
MTPAGRKKASEAVRTVHVVTRDQGFFASAGDAVRELGGWRAAHGSGVDQLLGAPPPAGDVILLDGALSGENVYEACRRLAGRTGCRTYVVVRRERALAEPIAHFCGATGTLPLPLTSSDLRGVLTGEAAPAPELAEAKRERGKEPVLPEELLRDISGGADTGLVGALTDPETGLFNYAFLHYKLEEEFKRAQRFAQPLACVMLGFEGEASEQVLRELSGIFLRSSRDTDVLGRFDVSSFLFLLPNTGLDGAQVLARRVGESATELGLRDLVGDPLQIAVGISFHPHPDVRKREDLFGRARKAFFAARQAGGGVVTSP